jgi:hypothetical protein
MVIGIFWSLIHDVGIVIYKTEIIALPLDIDEMALDPLRIKRPLRCTVIDLLTKNREKVSHIDPLIDLHQDLHVPLLNPL